MLRARIVRDRNHIRVANSAAEFAVGDAPCEEYVDRDRGREMFDLFFKAMLAYNQIIKLVAGLCASGIGALMIGYMAYLRRRDRLYEGEIVAVHRTEGSNRPMYTPMLAYVDEHGARHEGLANSSSSAIGGMMLGTRIKLLVDPESPRALMTMGDWWIVVIVGAVFALVGIPFIYSAVTHLQFDIPTVLIACAVSGFVGRKLYGKIHPLLDARKSGGVAALLKKYAKSDQQGAQESTPLMPEEIAELSGGQRKQWSRVLPAFVLVGTLMCAGGAYWTDQRIKFMAAAAIADGIVIRNEFSHSGDSSTYHAVVEFKDARGRPITYRDSVGANPPSFDPGEHVRIFYDASNPSRAMLDRGIWNWLLPVLIAAVGLLVALLSFKGYLANRRRAQRESRGTMQSA